MERVRKILLLILAVGIGSSVLSNCKCSRSGQAGINNTADCSLPKSQTATTSPDNALFECAKQVFYKIPDHTKVSEEAKPYMTKELYEALSAAWDVPRWCDGEIGDEEFLWYFVTGNGGSTVGNAVYVGMISVQDERYNLELKYTEIWGHKPDDELKTISLVMVEDNGKWLLDDFGNGTKGQCIDYIRKQVGDFISGRTITYMKDNQQADWYTDEHIANVQKAFKKYIDEYDVYLRRFLIPEMT